MSKIIFLVFSLIAFFAFFHGNQPNLSRLCTPLPFSLPSYGNVHEAQTILKQKFYYLASGGQMDVFVSEDEKYVLKFFSNTPLPLPFPSYQRRKLVKLSRDMR